MTFAKYALAVLLGTALAAGPAFADPADDLKKAVEKLEKATKELQEAKEALKVDELRSRTSVIEAKIDLLSNDLLDLRKDIREIKRRVGDNSSTSLRPDMDSATARGLGRVRFINEISEEMSVVVNGKSFRLLPGQERLIPVPAGNFTYQVLQLQRVAQERRIAAGETKTFNIFPLP
jgi:outer membrane murein-binding lipoprotein Lpp